MPGRPVRLSTEPVDNCVDGLRECRPSAESAEEFYEMITKSPRRRMCLFFSELGIQPSHLLDSVQSFRGVLTDRAKFPPAP